MSSPSSFTAFLSTSPSLPILFQHYQFFTQLHSNNPTVISYLTSTPSLLSSALSYITIQPSPSGTSAQKHKYPMMAIQLIQIQNQSIIQLFFQSNSIIQTNSSNLLKQLFSPFSKNQQILPLLCSYIQRAIKCLFKNRFSEFLEFVYENDYLFRQLIEHSYNKNVEIVLELMLNVDYTKEREEGGKRVGIKIGVVREVIGEIERLLIKKERDERQEQQLNNLGEYLIDTIERYHLISDGKRMLEQILSQSFLKSLFNQINLFQSSILTQTPLKLLKSLTNYYCMHILNSQSPDNPSANISNLKLLQSSPFISILCHYITQTFKLDQKIVLTFNYRLFRAVEILCHALCIRSHQLLLSLSTRSFFFPTIFTIFFSTDASIFHSLVEKTIAHIFYSMKGIYREYRQYLLGEMDLVGMMAKEARQGRKGKMWWGYGMGIIRVVLGEIDRGRKDGIKEIEKMYLRKRGEIEKLREVLRQYDEVTRKELGSYQIKDTNFGISNNDYFITKYQRKFDNQLEIITVKGKQIQQKKEIERKNHIPLSELMAMTTLSQSLQDSTEIGLKYSVQGQLKKSREIVDEKVEVKEVEEMKRQERESGSPFVQRQIIAEKIVQNTHISQIVQSSPTQYSYTTPQKLSPIEAPSSQPTLPPLSIPSPYLPPKLPTSPRFDSSPSFAQFMKRASKQAQQTIRIRRSSRDLTPVSKGLSPKSQPMKKSWTNSSVEKNPIGMRGNGIGFNSSGVVAPGLGSSDIQYIGNKGGLWNSNVSTMSNSNSNWKIKISKSPPKPSESKRMRVMQDKDIPILSFLGIIKTETK